MYRRLVRTWARELHLKNVLRKGRIVYGIYFQEEAENARKLVGFSIWSYPKHMVDELERDQNRQGILWTIYRFAISVRYNLGELWDYSFKPASEFEHPLNNARFNNYMNHLTDVLGQYNS